MANERTVTTDSISSILESARQQRQSGRLIVGQHIDGRIQEGEIYVQDGQAVYARLGTFMGQNALTRLLAWRNVHFTFYRDDPGEMHIQSGPAAQASDRSSAFPRVRTTGDVTFVGIDIDALIPQKRDTSRDVLSLPLTRPQRFIYFLVDGHRTLADLSRCTGKTMQEINRILSELHAQGLVIMPQP